MATFQKRRNDDGSVSVLAWVRVRPFKTVTKAHDSMADAKAWATQTEEELRREKKAGNTRVDHATLTLAQLNKAYLDDPPVKAKAYHGKLQKYLEYWDSEHGSVRVADFGPMQARATREKLMTGRAAATVDRYLAAQRSAWNWGRAARYISADRVWPPKLMLPEGDPRVRFLTDEELVALLQKSKAVSDVLHAAVLASIAIGCRKSELLRLKWRDIDFDRHRVRLLLTKNGSARAVHLPSEAAAALKELKQGKIVSAGGHVFLHTDGKPLKWHNLEVLWRKARTAAKLVDFRWHDLRHSCASVLAQSGSSLIEIASVLGHRQISVTKKYAHLVEGEPVTGSGKLNEKLKNAKA